MHWDAQKAKHELACPVLAPAARDDAIAISMSEATGRTPASSGHKTEAVLLLRHPRDGARAMSLNRQCSPVVARKIAVLGARAEACERRAQRAVADGRAPST